MSVTLQINGIEYDGFTTVKVARSFSNAANNFSFTSVSSTLTAYPIQCGDKCVVNINKIPVITGFIEDIAVDYADKNHSVTFSGRDRTCDIVDSTANDKTIFNPPITLVKVIQNILNILNIKDIRIVQNTTITPFNVTEIESAAIGSTYFSFIDTLCRLRQVFINTDGKGNITLDKASKVKMKTVILMKINGINNNVKSCSAKYDFRNRFSLYRVYSQANAVAHIDVVQTNDQLTSVIGETAFDPSIRKTRQYNFICEKSAADAEVTNRATWEANLRRAQSKIYNCVLQGFSAQADGVIWQPNFLVQVDDDFADMHGTFFVKDVTYNLTADSGESTELGLVVEDAFTLQALQNSSKAKVNVQGNNFVVQNNEFD